ITRAAMDLHQTVGPAHTTVAAVARRAGVRRQTVYDHFPDEESLFRACSGHWIAEHPFPDPGRWAAEPDPVARMRMALRDLYARHESTEQMSANIFRDAPLIPVLGRVVAENNPTDMLVALLAEPFGDASAPARLRAAIGHAISFSTWQSLVRHRGLITDEAVELMVGFVAGVAVSGEVAASAGVPAPSGLDLPKCPPGDRQGRIGAL
ncbi:MAG: helix-turn-helix transcriptional regulator, partial [Chloroflexi bacterium]|nr:helix-turn-helix transcriptional regulator [Chloroflexota bacterium]